MKELEMRNGEVVEPSAWDGVSCRSCGRRVWLHDTGLCDACHYSVSLTDEEADAE